MKATYWAVILLFNPSFKVVVVFQKHVLGFYTINFFMSVKIITRPTLRLKDTGLPYIF